jgi:hypothetical protein
LFCCLLVFVAAEILNSSLLGIWGCLNLGLFEFGAASVDLQLCDSRRNEPTTCKPKWDMQCAPILLSKQPVRWSTEQTVLTGAGGLFKTAAAKT